MSTDLPEAGREAILEGLQRVSERYAGAAAAKA
jgi:hypothetical protein